MFDTKPYDREFFTRAAEGGPVEWRFHEFRLNADTAPAAHGATAVCAFVNDHQAFLTQEALGEIARVTSRNLLHFRHAQPFLPDTSL